MTFKKYTGKELFQYAWQKKLEEIEQKKLLRKLKKQCKRRERFEKEKERKENFINNLPDNLPKLAKENENDKK